LKFFKVIQSQAMLDITTFNNYTPENILIKKNFKILNESFKPSYYRNLTLTYFEKFLNIVFKNGFKL
jgi:hypothetical protein